MAKAKKKKKKSSGIEKQQAAIPKNLMGKKLAGLRISLLKQLVGSGESPTTKQGIKEDIEACQLELGKAVEAAFQDGPITQQQQYEKLIGEVDELTTNLQKALQLLGYVKAEPILTDFTTSTRAEINRRYNLITEPVAPLSPAQKEVIASEEENTMPDSVPKKYILDHLEKLRKNLHAAASKKHLTKSQKKDVKTYIDRYKAELKRLTHDHFQKGPIRSKEAIEQLLNSFEDASAYIRGYFSSNKISGHSIINASFRQIRVEASTKFQLPEFRSFASTLTPRKRTFIREYEDLGIAGQDILNATCDKLSSIATDRADKFTQALGLTPETGITEERIKEIPSFFTNLIELLRAEIKQMISHRDLHFDSLKKAILIALENGNAKSERDESDLEAFNQNILQGMIALINQCESIVDFWDLSSTSENTIDELFILTLISPQAHDAEESQDTLSIIPPSQKEKNLLFGLWDEDDEDIDDFNEIAAILINENIFGGINIRKDHEIPQIIDLIEQEPSDLEDQEEDVDDDLPTTTEVEEADVDDQVEEDDNPDDDFVAVEDDSHDDNDESDDTDSATDSVDDEQTEAPAAEPEDESADVADSSVDDTTEIPEPYPSALPADTDLEDRVLESRQTDDNLKSQMPRMADECAEPNSNAFAGGGSLTAEDPISMDLTSAMALYDVSTAAIMHHLRESGLGLELLKFQHGLIVEATDMYNKRNPDTYNVDINRDKLEQLLDELAEFKVEIVDILNILGQQMIAINAIIMQLKKSDFEDNHTNDEMRQAHEQLKKFESDLEKHLKFMATVQDIIGEIEHMETRISNWDLDMRVGDKYFNLTLKDATKGASPEALLTPKNACLFEVNHSTRAKIAEIGKLIREGRAIVEDVKKAERITLAGGMDKDVSTAIEKLSKVLGDKVHDVVSTTNTDGDRHLLDESADFAGVQAAMETIDKLEFPLHMEYGGHEFDISRELYMALLVTTRWNNESSDYGRTRTWGKDLAGIINAIDKVFPKFDIKGIKLADFQQDISAYLYTDPANNRDRPPNKSEKFRDREVLFATWTHEGNRKYYLPTFLAFGVVGNLPSNYQPSEEFIKSLHDYRDELKRAYGG